MEHSESSERVKFYGPRDLASGWLSEQAVKLIRDYSHGRKVHSLNDALELHNALAFEEHNVVPRSLTEQERQDLAQSAQESRRRVPSFFACFETSDLDQLLADFEYEYADDLILLLERHEVAKRVGGQELFDALLKSGMPLSIMLSNPRFVKRHDRRLRDVLLADAQHGGLLVRMRLIKDVDTTHHLPASFSGVDSQQLLRAYIESASPHPNHVQAIAEANDNPNFGITPKIRLQAKKRYQGLIEELFSDETNTLVKNRYGIRIDPEQREPVLDDIEHEEDGITHMRSLGGRYLSATLEPESVLANFAAVVGYADRQGLLSMPSVKTQMGTLERLLLAGKDSYPRGQAFKHVDALTSQGTHAYGEFLRQNRIEVEDVVATFFREQLTSQYDAAGFYYTPSSTNSSFLERCRHISAEMESIARQFTLYCHEGELDPELLRMTSSPRPWSEIPSLIEHKYLRMKSPSDCELALHLLFNDQSRLTYVNKSLRARSFVQLATENELPYNALHHYQKAPVDWLIAEKLVSVNAGLILFSQPALILVLNDIYNHEAAPFGRYGEDESAAALALVDKGWLTFSSTLLTSAEASYFNFYLNKSEFSDGPDLRNRYLHGTNPDPSDLAAHIQAYMLLLRLLVSLTLKIRDDFQLSVTRFSAASK
ncbi:hypothetical protein [Paenarthrobacter nitroguajacolicus]|uniref:hypothetical protein n=1 Tax=Paenarthrobacter nitroguajacolicus TaxID=211146 RepID=UPI0028595777|nr:hypothetical protein [Paenarthrobacter nitroguajacolicus]MDR6637077.1 hypothetical protein [Paenarthrobacter nitroguajacolicus]